MACPATIDPGPAPRHHRGMKPRFTLRQLEYVIATAEHGTIAAASQVLNVSSPSISTAIAQLEEALNAPVFLHRRAKGLQLTETGRLLVAQAERVMQEAHELSRLAASVSGEVQGPLRLGCLVSFAQIVAPALRRSFEALYPEVHLRQSEMTQSDLFTGLRRGEIDLALSYAIDVPQDLEFHPIHPLPPFVMLDPEHPLAKAESVTVAELAPHPMVLLDLPLSSDYFLSFFAREALRPRIAERTRDMAVARSLVANGFGYAIGNFRPVGASAPDGRPLVFVPLQSAAPPMELGLLCAKGALERRSCGAFLEHCREELVS